MLDAFEDGLRGALDEFKRGLERFLVAVIELYVIGRGRCDREPNRGTDDVGDRFRLGLPDRPARLEPSFPPVQHFMGEFMR